MKLLQDLKGWDNYKSHVSEYASWKQAQDNANAKRQEYLKQNPQEINYDDIQRGKALLNAIDTMDEYSQTRAEDTEVATEMAISGAMQLIQFVGMAAGLGATLLPPVQKGLNALGEKYPKIGLGAAFIPTGIGIITAFVASMPLMAWGAKMEVGASRKGRFEAMRNDLQNPNTFAVLTDEQTKKVEEEAAKITLDKNEEKGIINAQKGKGILAPFKTLADLLKGDAEYEAQKSEFDKTLEAQVKNFDKEVSQKDVERAKRDQQILAKLVHKIDVKSQDYAESVEHATGAFQSILLTGGVLTGFLSKGLLKLLKVGQNSAVGKYIIPIAVGVATIFPLSVAAAKIQKQASRVGRFNVKQEMHKNPSELVFVADEKIANTQTQALEKEKKPGYFKFLKQVYNENKVYEEYMKIQGSEIKKRQKALEQMELSEQQIKDAKSLQQNTFKTFNEVDEKSQAYAEKVEAVGSIATNLLAIPAMIPIVAAPMVSMNNFTDMAESASKKIMFKHGAIGAAKSLGLFALGTAPLIGMNWYITKEQKKASRVANMLGIKELQDYRHYVDYENLGIEASASKQKAPEKNALFSNPFKDFKF